MFFISTTIFILLLVANKETLAYIQNRIFRTGKIGMFVKNQVNPILKALKKHALCIVNKKTNSFFLFVNHEYKLLITQRYMHKYTVYLIFFKAIILFF